MSKLKLCLLVFTIFLHYDNSFALSNLLNDYNDYQWNLVKSVNLKEINKDWSNINYYGDNFTGAWKFISENTNIKKPGEGVIVGVVDMGYILYPNFSRNLKSIRPGSNQYGYNFVYDCRRTGRCFADANISVWRDPKNYKPTPNAEDLGNYVSREEKTNRNSVFYSYNHCNEESDWHGTQMIGVIINNGLEQFGRIKGGAYGAEVVPVLSHGKCDENNIESNSIINGMKWAAGLSADNAEKNQYPTQVISVAIE